MNIPSSERLEKVYGESAKSAERLNALAENFRKKYGHDDAEFTGPVNFSLRPEEQRSSETTRTIMAERSSRAA